MTGIVQFNKTCVGVAALGVGHCIRLLSAGSLSVELFFRKRKRKIVIYCLYSIDSQKPYRETAQKNVLLSRATIIIIVFIINRQG